uniref:Uncharacterized protein n=1 Tax=Candidatus Nitrotoga fabula TaxID=2182327 RepID=A0A2X0RA27_9PROT|nr:protein of unknown function [Candidatus Nitrotoga fabula]
MRLYSPPVQNNKRVIAGNVKPAPKNKNHLKQATDFTHLIFPWNHDFSPGVYSNS